MKIKYVFGIIAILLLLNLSGCSGKGEVVNGEDISGVATEEVETESTSGGDSGKSNEDVDVKELIKELSEEAGLETDSEEEEVETEEETVYSEESSVIELSIDSFEDLAKETIKVGDTVKWTNNMDNYKHAIIILPQKNNSNKYEYKEINDIVYILKGESYEFTFNDEWNYKWGSKTKYDKVYGLIEVTE